MIIDITELIFPDSEDATAELIEFGLYDWGAAGMISANVNNLMKPTCEQMFDGELGSPIDVQVESGWRHGVTKTAVYKRTSDNTYWETVYLVSTDGETHELRSGEADIRQVEPFQQIVTRYRPIRTTVGT